MLKEIFNSEPGLYRPVRFIDSDGEKYIHYTSAC